MNNVIIYKTGRQTLDFKVCRFKGSQKYLRLLCKEKGIVYSDILSEEQLIKNKTEELDKLLKKYGSNKMKLIEFLYSDYKIEENFDYEKYEKSKEQYSYIGAQNKRRIFEWLKENEIVLQKYTHIYDLVERYKMHIIYL
ncbi:hypothetical protein H3018_gp01 [Bacillus phage DK3]|uniref:Uncharacterized protein n=1 Tax=Bacillus phage DK3 TaxID=2500810 RepID=A0A3T0IJ57_9CAUD|nr:hypothetical protein H3018_gp01 [Bacillus phage DK3]AZU99799.1 hypothetical protein DK3_00001 [Bacillus phage DK3]